MDRPKKPSDKQCGYQLWKSAKCQAIVAQLKAQGVDKKLLEPAEAAMQVVDEYAQKLHNVADRLKASVIKREHLIAFWEQVLSVGAKELLEDAMSESPKYPHLVEHYKRTTKYDKEGNQTVTEEIKMPSRKDATAVLTVLKKLGEETQAQDSPEADIARYIRSCSRGLQ